MFTEVKTELRDEAYAKGQKMGEKALTTQVAAVETTLHQAFDQAESNDNDLTKVTAFGEKLSASEVIEQIVACHSELAGYQDALKEKEELRNVREEIFKSNNDDGAAAAASQAAASEPKVKVPYMSDYFWNSVKGDELKSAASHPVLINMEMPGSDILNVLFSRSAGWDPESIREPGWRESPQRPVELLDLIPSRPATQAAIKYMQEQVFTNATAATSEGAALPEGALRLAERTVTIEKYGMWLPVTEEQLEDVPEVNAYLNGRMPFMVRQRVEEAILTGDGTAPNISGFFNQAITGTNPRPGISVRDITATGAGAATVLTDGAILADVLRGINLVRTVGYARPSSIWMHPSLLEAIMIAQLSNNAYFFGNPQDGYQPRLWGLPVAESNAFGTYASAATPGKPLALLGDFMMYSALRVKRDFELRVGMQNDDFVKDQMTMKATVRFALVVYRPQAFCSLNFVQG